MDVTRFDFLTRSLTDARSRRGALVVLLGGSLGLLGLVGLTEATAKKNKKGKKDKPVVDRNCDSFSTQREAQNFFLSEGGPNEDPHGLDTDHDSIACENLP